MNVVAAANELLRELKAEGKRHGVASITRVHVRMGTLCDIPADDLAHAFRTVAGGTVASGADLNIGIVAAKGWCPACSADVPLRKKDGQGFFCTECGKLVDKPISGQELEVALIRGGGWRLP